MQLQHWVGLSYLYFVVSINYLAQFCHIGMWEAAAPVSTVHPLPPSADKGGPAGGDELYPKVWGLHLCSSNSDPDLGAHGKGLVLSEVYLPPVCWTKSSGIGLVPVPRWISIHRQPGFSGGM